MSGAQGYLRKYGARPPGSGRVRKPNSSGIIEVVDSRMPMTRERVIAVLSKSAYGRLLREIEPSTDENSRRGALMQLEQLQREGRVHFSRASDRWFLTGSTACPRS